MPEKRNDIAVSDYCCFVVDSMCRIFVRRVTSATAVAFVVVVFICFVLIENAFHFYFFVVVVVFSSIPIQFDSFLICWCFTRMKTNRLCCLIDVVACNVHLKFGDISRLSCVDGQRFNFNRHHKHTSTQAQVQWMQCVLRACISISFGFVYFSFHVAFAVTPKRCGGAKKKEKKDLAKALNVRK